MTNTIYQEPKSYTYLCIHRETGGFYFGWRKANKLPAIYDLGTKYFTSSELVKLFWNEFDFHVLLEDKDYNKTYLYEQELIKEFWGSPLLLNANHTGPNGMMIFNRDSSGKQNSMYGKKHSIQSIEKMRINRAGIPSWNSGLKGSQKYQTFCCVKCFKEITTNNFTQHTISCKGLQMDYPKPKTILCIHCNKEFDVVNFKRWHGDNCKFKSGDIYETINTQ